MEFELGIPVSDTVAGEAVSTRYIDEDEVLAVDSVFFKFFSYKLLKGDVDKVFTERNHLVITESLALKLFGEEDPVGQEVRMGEGGWFEVAGIVEDPPETSSFQFNALLGFHVMEELGYPMNGYGGTMYFNNFKLIEGCDVPALNTAINEYMAENYDLDLDANFFMDRLTRVHLFGETRGIQGVYLNIIIALVILTIACINFINLTTAYASERVKEIAIRKSAGASKRQLITQFMGETYLLLLLALYLGLFPGRTTGSENSPVLWVRVTCQFFRDILLEPALAGFPADRAHGRALPCGQDCRIQGSQFSFREGQR